LHSVCSMAPSQCRRRTRRSPRPAGASSWIVRRVVRPVVRRHRQRSAPAVRLPAGRPRGSRVRCRSCPVRPAARSSADRSTRTLPCSARASSPRPGTLAASRRDARCQRSRLPTADAIAPHVPLVLEGSPRTNAIAHGLATKRVEKGGLLPHLPHTLQRRASRRRSAVSVGVRPTRTPAASRALSLASAVPVEPSMRAPAWPIVLPSGAVKPAT